jgi:hypothetical protein
MSVEEVVFLSDIVETWSENDEEEKGKSNVGQDKFLNLLTKENGYKKQRLLTKLVYLAANSNKTNCFATIFPHFLKTYQEVSKSAFGNAKIDLHFISTTNKNDRIISLLSKNNFLPHGHELRSQIINYDSSLLNVFDGKTINQVVKISLQLFHREENRQFLKKFIAANINNFDFNAWIVKYCSPSDEEEDFEKAKLFIEIGHNSYGDEKKFGQVFIKNAWNRGLSRSKRIDNLIFLIDHGGKEIDRIFSCSTKEEIFERFFQLTVRKIEFKTNEIELLNRVVEFINGLRNQLLSVGIIKEIVDVVLCFY